jgi:hypothetical protein
MDFDHDISRPHLTEPGINYYLNETLKQCHKFKVTYNNNLVNLGLLVFFLIILGCILLYKYKGRLTREEIKRRNREKQQYILSKVKNFQEAKRTAHQDLISGLPGWDNEYDAIIGNKKHINL